MLTLQDQLAIMRRGWNEPHYFGQSSLPRRQSLLDTSALHTGDAVLNMRRIFDEKSGTYVWQSAEEKESVK